MSLKRINKGKCEVINPNNDIMYMYTCMISSLIHKNFPLSQPIIVSISTHVYCTSILFFQPPQNENPSPNRTCGPRKRSSSQLLRWTGRRRYVPLAGHNYGTRRLPLRRRRLLPRHPLPCRLPLQASKGTLHNPHLPLQHQLQWRHLLRYFEGPMEPSPHH